MPRRTVPLTLNVHTWPSVRPHIGHVGAFIPPHDEIVIFNNDFPLPQAEKSPFQQHAVSYTPESDLLDWGFRMAQGSSLLTR